MKAGTLEISDMACHLICIFQDITNEAVAVDEWVAVLWLRAKDDRMDGKGGIGISRRQTSVATECSAHPDSIMKCPRDHEELL